MKTKLLISSLYAFIFSLSASATLYNGNGNGGFGGPIGGSTLEITDNGVTISFTLTRGAGGPLNDAFTLYIDSQSGGVTSTSGINDQADDGRRAISGFDGTNQSLVNFSSGFGADFGLMYSADFGGFLFGLATGGNNSLGFIAGAGGGGVDPAGTTFSYSVSLASLGLSPGDSFDFVGTYLNKSNGFRSDEALGTGITPGNPGIPSSIQFTSALTYTTIPEPTTLSLLASGVFGMLRLRRFASTR